jgi:nitroreductase
MKKEDYIAFCEWRHACKEFDATKKISDSDFSFLLEVIRLSPSSFGLQPYNVIVLQNTELLQDLHPHMWGAQKQLFSASHIIMFTVKKDIVNSDYIKNIMINVQKTPDEMIKLRHDLIQDHLSSEIEYLKDERYLLDWAGKQAYIALGNVMHAASSIGIDSCPIEGFVKDKVIAALDSHNVIDNKSQQPLVFCAFGHRLQNPLRPKTRKPIDELVRYFK